MKSKFSKNMLDDTITSLMANLLRAGTVEFRIAGKENDVLLYESHATVELNVENRKIIVKYERPTGIIQMPFDGRIYHRIVDENGDTLIETVDIQWASGDTLEIVNDFFDITLTSD